MRDTQKETHGFYRYDRHTARHNSTQSSPSIDTTPFAKIAMTPSVKRNRLSASLPSIEDKHLPPLDLGIGIAYQAYVNAGIAAATDFVRHISDFSLHKHFSCTVHSFTASLIGEAERGRATTPQACVNAFIAGYLGRIQQEMRLFQSKGFK